MRWNPVQILCESQLELWILRCLLNSLSFCWRFRSLVICFFPGVTLHCNNSPYCVLKCFYIVLCGQLEKWRGVWILGIFRSPAGSCSLWLACLFVFILLFWSYDFFFFLASSFTYFKVYALLYFIKSMCFIWSTFTG